MSLIKIINSPRYVGNSSDTMPDVEIGALFIEEDTRKVYIYDGLVWTFYCKMGDLYSYHLSL